MANNRKTRKYIILLLAFLLILRVLSCSIIPDVNEKMKERCQPIETQTQISAIEVEKFLKDWAEYVENGYNKKVSDKVSLVDGPLEDQLPEALKLWFNKKCWTIQRFYYIEDRLKTALQTLYLRRHSESILAILKDRMNEENESEYKNIIEMQKQIVNVENISNEELKFIEMREAEIVKILNMK